MQLSRHAAPSSSRTAPVRSRRQLSTQALFGRKSSVAVAEPEVEEKPRKIKESVVAQTFNALDFAAPRSKRDAELLYDAKYGERSPDGKMSREQYQALRRKIGGTYKDFFKGYVEEERVENTYTNSKATAVPYLPVLVGITMAVLASTVLVVQQTGAQ